MRKITAKDLFSILSYRGFLRWMPSPLFLKLKYRIYTGRKLNLNDPQTFNEKLQWLKLYNADFFNPLYTKLTDKIQAKDIIASKIGEQYIIPTIGVWDCFDDIDFDSLPNEFVLKTNHDSGSVIVVKNKNELDKATAKTKFKKSMKVNFYWYGREPQYRDIKPQIFAEKFISNNSDEELMSNQKCGNLEEYKIFCFNGKAKMILVCKGKAHGAGRTNDYCDLDLNRFPFTSLNPNSEGELERPKQMDKMIELAEKLAEGIPQVRVDLYLCNDNIYFGELTFYHNSGLAVINPQEWDIKLGSWIELPERRK